MKRIWKKLKGKQALPLLWQDSSWTTRVNIRPQPPSPHRRGSLPFSPFRGFHFPQPVTQKI